MNVVQPIPIDQLEAYARIDANTYPEAVFAGESDIRKYTERMQAQAQDLSVSYHGYYRDGQLLGGMKFYDYTMHLLSATVPAGGVGLVAVDILHKKEKIARDMMGYFLRYYRDRGAPITLLYPFRPDFYHQMGFGYGTKMSQYRVPTGTLPRGGERSKVAFVTQDQQQLLLDCYTRYAHRTHGMIDKRPYELTRLFGNPNNRIVGYREGDRLLGYLVFTFKQPYEQNFILSNIHVGELIYETPEALAGLLAFLQSQDDQIDRVVFNTQDENFHYLLTEPRNGGIPMIPHVYHESNVQGVGLMYRIVDTPAIFRALAAHDFGGQTCALKLTIADTFLPENAGTLILHVENGRARIVASSECDVEVRLDIAEFSSLLMGCVPFKSLYDYGLATISNPEYVATITRLFRTEEKPICTTPF